MNELIKFENVTKYKIDPHHNKKKKLSNILSFEDNPLESKEIALKDISFILKEGEHLGITGPGGSGKSLLLKLIEGKIIPDKGKVFINDIKIGNAMTSKAGFRFDLSVRENIFIKSMLHGANKGETKKMLNNILEFSEFSKSSLNKKLKTFSVQEHTQLSYAIMTAYEYDVFLFDDKVEVGNKEFILKCKNRVQYIAKRSSLVIASKYIKTIKSYCTQKIILPEH